MSVQISAYIQDDTKQKLENYSSNHGMKKGFIIENAIEYYLQALCEFPSNIIVPSGITISEDTYKQLKQIEIQNPTDKLKNLLS